MAKSKKAKKRKKQKRKERDAAAGEGLSGAHRNGALNGDGSEPRIGPIERLDLAIAAWATKIGRLPVVKPVVDFAELADQPPLIVTSLATISAGEARGDERLKRAGMRMLAAFLIATAAKAVGKHYIARTRPSWLVDEGDYDRGLNGPDTHDWNAFPSGHTAGAVAVARALAREYPEHEGEAMSAAVTAGVLKVFKGDHYPSDLAAGFVLGLAAEALAARVFRDGR